MQVYNDENNLNFDSLAKNYNSNDQAERGARHLQPSFRLSAENNNSLKLRTVRIPLK